MSGGGGGGKEDPRTDPAAFDKTAVPVDETVSATRGLGSPEGRLCIVDPSHYASAGEHARGGLGRILRARDDRTGRLVAIKEILPGAPDAASRLAREALITANLQHPAIIPVYEVGRWPSGQPFYAMKLVAGRSLREVIADAHDLNARLALLPHIIAVADALAYAHASGVIHRDLKPANVLVGDFGETVVIDWGLAKRIGRDDNPRDAPTPVPALPAETQAGSILGTPAYMPPEQAAGRPTDERADVYALGAMLYHLLTGKIPHADARTTEEVLRRVRAGELPRLRRVEPGVPRDLGAIVDKAMARSPDARYPTAKEMAEDLRRFHTGQLVSAHRYTAWQRIRRWVGRRRALVAVAAAAMAAVIAVGVTSLNRVLAERNFAREQKVLAERSAAAAQVRLGEMYAEMGRQEVLGEHSLRALPLLAEAARLGYGGFATRFLVGRALDDMVPALAARPFGPLVAFAFTPDQESVFLAGSPGEMLLWRFGEGRDAWRVPASPEGNRRADVSPDRKWIGTAGAGEVALYDLATGAKAGAFPFAGEGISFTSDGSRLVAATDEGEVQVWSIDPFRRKQSLRVEAGKGTSAVLTADGTRLIVVSDRTSSLWDPATGRRIADLCPRDIVCGLTHLSDGEKWISVTRADEGGETGLAWLLDAATGRLRATFTHEAVLKDAVFSPDDRLLATPSLDGKTLLWSVPDGALVRTLPMGSQAVSTRFSPDGTRLAVGTGDGTALLYDVASGLRTARSETGGLWIDVLFSQDGRRLATAGIRGLATVLDVARPGPTVWMRGPKARVRVVAYAPDGRRVSVVSDDGSVTLRDSAAGAVVIAPAGHEQAVLWTEFSPDGSQVVTASRDGTVVLWDALGGSRRMALTGHTGRVRRAAFRPDGARLATAATDKTVKIWDLPSGKELHSLPHAAPLMGLRWAPGGRWLVSLDEEGTVGVFDGDTGKKLGEAEGHGGGIDIAIAPDASVLARTAKDDEMSLYALPSGVKTKEMEGATGQGFGIGFSPDGRRLASAHLDGKTRIWEVASRKLVATLDVGRPMLSVVWDPRGRWVATGGTDRRVRIWDPDSGRELAGQSMPQDIYWLAVSPDGDQIAAASLGPDSLLWNVPSWAGDLTQLDRTISCRVPWRLQNGGLIAAEPTPSLCVGKGP